MRLDLFVACCTLALTACGAGENHLDPGDLELRDVLGVAPEVATGWDAEQRTAARGVIEAGLHASDAAPMHAVLAPGEPLAKALAATDAERAQRHAGALGVVSVVVDRGSVTATARHATLEPHANAPIAIETAGWGAKALDAHELEVVAELAIDAGHRAGPLIVTPAPQLAVAAGYVPATAGEPARLVVNPVVLAVLEPAAPAIAMQGTGGGLAITPPPPTVSASAPGNPYSFYGSVGECAAAQKLRCDACLPDSSCKPIIGGSDGNAECARFAEQQDRGFSLVCINLALAIDTVSSCAASAAPGCPRDTHASESLAALENNAIFVDDGTCRAPLDHCLGSLFGTWGTGSGSPPPPRDPSPTTGCSGDQTCDPGTGCELDGSSCDDGGSSCDDSSSAGDSGCSSSDGSSGCDGGGCDDSGESSCDSSGDGCSGDSGGCDSGGDCGGGGGDCGGGGGDCGGGGGDCNATARHGRNGGGTPIAVLWALLPIPFARRVKRRADRKRAREAVAS